MNSSELSVVESSSFHDFTIASCEAPMDVLRQRVRERRGDASEADLAVLEMLAGAGQPLGKAEQPFVERYPAA